MTKFSPAAVFLIAVCSSLITGCSTSTLFPSVEPASAAPPSLTDTRAGVLKGKLHGGQQPIAGASIYLLAAGTQGYGSPAKSLLTSASYPGYASQQDTQGNYYVTTDANGFFQIADSCTPGQQVYVASVGGNPGGGINTAANEIAILGACPQDGNFDSTLTGVFISEISTVAAAYTAAAYATDTFDIGAPSGTLAQTGIANAFANAANLFDVQNLNDLARTTTVSGSGTVPQAKLNTIANIFASCINSGGPTSPSCATLFANTKTGGTTGTAPTDVTTAAINLAHNQSSLGMSLLFSLQTTNSPFSPALAAAPGDFTLPVDYTNAAAGVNPSLAIDGNGNVWTLSPGVSAVTKISPTGAIPVPQYAIGNGFSGSRGLAIDAANNVWVLGQGTGNELILNTLVTFPVATFAELNSVGVYQKTLTETPVLGSRPPTASTNLVIDGTGAFYYSAVRNLLTFNSTTCCTEKFNPGTSTFTDLDNGNSLPGTNFVAVSKTAEWATSDSTWVSYISGATQLKASGGGMSATVGVALDNAGRAWMVNSGNNSITLFGSTGTVISTTPYTGNLATPEAIAVDGAGNVWATNSQGSLDLAQFSSVGAPIGNGYASAGLASAGALAIDPSGNIWVGSSTSATLTQFLGLAAPVVTPAATAIGAGTLGAKP